MHAQVAELLDLIQGNRLANTRGDRIVKLTVVTSGRLGIALHPLDMLFGRLGRDVHPKPAIADLPDAPQRRFALTPENNRWMRGLDGLGIGADFREAAELTAELRLFLGPQHFHNFEILTRALRPAFPGDAHRGELFRQPAHTHAEIKTPARQLIQAGDFFRGDDRIALGYQANAGSQADRFGLRGGIR